MSKPTTAISSHRAIKPLLCSVCLFLLLAINLPMTALAAPPAPPGAEKCIGCHPAETASWQDSSHAKAILDDKSLSGVTCESCHGVYVVGHPEEGLQQLTVNSIVCEDCHINTFEEWKHSTHAKAGVQCIGCHLSHSQEFRLDEEALCHSCHRQQYRFYSTTPHSDAGLTCADCHFPAEPVSAMAFSNAECATCHEGTVHQTLGTLHQASTVPMSSGNIQPVVDSNFAPEQRAVAETEIAARTDELSESSKSLIYLGMGTGIGGMLGILFMQLIGYISMGRVKK